MGIVGTNYSGLANSTTYYFKINGTEYSILTGSGILPYPTYQDVANLIEVEVSPSYACVLYGPDPYNEDIYIFNRAILGFGSTVLLAQGTSGPDLFSNLIGWAGFNESPVLPYSPQASTIVALTRDNFNNFTELGSPTILPTGSANSVAINQSVTQLAVAHNSSPYVTTYSVLSYALTDAILDAFDNSVNTVSGNFLIAGFAIGQIVNMISNTAKIVNVQITNVTATKMNITGITLTSQSVPNLTVSSFNKLANPSSLPSSTGQAVAFSSSGTYLAVAYQNGFIVYEWNGVVFNAVTTEALGPCYCCTFSNDENYLAVGSSVSPYIYIYSRSGSVFSLISSPGILPTGTVLSCAFSNTTSNYLVVGTNSSPYLIAYVKSGSVFNQLTNLSYSNVSSVTGCAFNYNDSYLVASSNAGQTIILYQFSGIFVPVPVVSPSVPPTAATGITFSESGFLVAASDTSSPYIDVYFQNGNVLFSEQHLNTLPNSASKNCTISFDNKYLVTVNSDSPYINLYGLNVASNALITAGLALTKYVPVHFYIASGTAVLSGHVTAILNYSYIASGTAVLSGSANFSIGNEYTYTASGTAILSGAALTTRYTAYYIYNFAGGTAIFSGTVDFSVNGDIYVYTPYPIIAYLSGAIADNILNIIATVHSGTARFSGSVISILQKYYSYTASGTAIFSGSASHTIVFSYIASGTAIFSGAAATYTTATMLFYGDTFYNVGYYT